MAQSRVKFFRGLESTYILQGGVAKTGADVAFKNKFLNGVYFATDTGVIYVNGRRYGFCNTKLSSLVSSVEYTNPTATTPASIKFLDSEGNEIQTVNLFRVYSGTPEYLTVDIDAENNYKISLDLSNATANKVGDNDNVIVTDDDGRLGVYLGMERDEVNGLINFGSYDKDGVFTSYGSIDENEFKKDTYLESVSTETVTTENGGTMKVIRFTWNDSIKGESNGSNTVIDIPIESLMGDEISEIKNLTVNGKALSGNPILTGLDISVGSYELETDEETGEFLTDIDVDKDSVAAAVAKLKYRMALTATDASVRAIQADLAGIHEKVDNISFEDIATLKIQGSENGDYVNKIEVSEENPNEVIITKGSVAQANLIGYENVDRGVITSAFSINQAIQNLDESATWKNVDSANTPETSEEEENPTV